MTMKQSRAVFCACALLLAGSAKPAPAASAPATTIPATTIPSDANSKAHANWFGECQARVAAMQGTPVDIIFIGDSITQNWAELASGGWNEVGGPVWQK